MPLMTDSDTPIRTIFPEESTTLHVVLAVLPDRLTQTFQLWFYGCVAYEIDPICRGQTGFGYRFSRKRYRHRPGRLKEWILTEE